MGGDKGALTQAVEEGFIEVVGAGAGAGDSWLGAGGPWFEFGGVAGWGWADDGG